MGRMDCSWFGHFYRRCRCLYLCYEEDLGIEESEEEEDSRERGNEWREFLRKTGC